MMTDDSSSKKTAGRPERIVPNRQIDITAMDPVTFRMIEALVAYGRFGRTKQEVALFIIRSWLLDREAYLKTAIAARESPLGLVEPETE
jgi:hypothetical protein